MTNQTSTSRAETNRGEQQFFRTLNRLVEPVLRAGLGNSLAGPGAFVLETTGRRSGRPRRVPLLGKRIGDTIIVSTIRDNSQWIRNLEQHPHADVWVAGRPRPATATVVRLSGGAVARLRLESSPRRNHSPTRNHSWHKEPISDRTSRRALAPVPSRRPAGWA